MNQLVILEMSEREELTILRRNAVLGALRPF